MREFIQDEYAAQNNAARAERMNTPSFMLKPRLIQFGNQWIAQYDELSACGASPDEAFYNFDKAWYHKTPLPDAGDV